MARKCNKLDDFREQFVRKKLGIDEHLWEALQRRHLEDRRGRRIQRQKYRVSYVRESEKQVTEEEDELESDDEGPPQPAATSARMDVGQRQKRRRTTIDTGGPHLDLPSAKKRQVRLPSSAPRFFQLHSLASFCFQPQNGGEGDIAELESKKRVGRSVRTIHMLVSPSPDAFHRSRNRAVEQG